MEFTVVNLGELPGQRDHRKFGNKALMLAKIEKYGVRILPGFCVLISGKDAFQADKLKENISFREQYTRIIGKKSKQKLIARSSGMLEDSQEHLFPGIYKSISGIESMSQLLDAIEACYQSQKSDVAKWYSKTVRAKEAECFCVLIQRELQPEYSGITYTKLPFAGYWSGSCMMVQMVEGTSTLLAKGGQTGNTYVLHEKLQRWEAEKEIHYKCLERKICVEPTIEKRVLEYLYREGRKLAEIFGSDLDIEWAYQDDKIYVFQVRPITDRKIKEGVPFLSETGEQNHILFECDNDNGLKWNAMRYFIENGMFEKWALLLESKLSLEEIRTRLYSADFEQEQLTVRFSYKNQIGMPRAFVYGKDDAFEFIQKNRTRECALIIYENIFVQDSYEIYLDEEKIIVEHVPGVWESDSKLMADSMVIYEEYTDFWRVDTSRDAKFEDYFGSSKRSVPPLSKEELIEERAELQKYIGKIRKMANQNCPLNVHYVRDHRRKIYFLNFRLSKHITNFCAYGKDAFPVKDVEDFKKWDGITPLLVCPDLSRGEEILLMQLVPYLKEVSAPILVDFGILSHPAIMLREMGINITPRFMCHDYFRDNKF